MDFGGGLNRFFLNLRYKKQLGALITHMWDRDQADELHSRHRHGHGCWVQEG